MSVNFSHDLTKLLSALSDKTVKTWIASTGVYLQPFEGHSSKVSFGSTGSHKRTDIGLVAIVTSHHSGTLTSEAQQSGFQSIEIS